MTAVFSSILNKTVTIILAGGQGERLYPLTKDRSKPSVPFGGNYRIIDFTLSNCINSGLRHIFLLTQYKSQSLNRHISEGWNILHRDLGEFIEPVPPQHRSESRWYEGTANAIYQNLHLLEQWKPERVLILSGDHIYRMNYLDLLAHHIQKQADVTISSFKFPRRDSSAFGCMSVDKDNRILEFVEKPDIPPAIPNEPEHSLVNMGVYVFNTSTLVRAVIQDAKDSTSIYDIGKNVIPRLLEEKKSSLFSYAFTNQHQNPYWRDVGSIDSYYDASMALLDDTAPIDLFSTHWPFRTDARSLPPACFSFSSENPGSIHLSMVGNGCVIDGSLQQCILSPQVTIGHGSTLKNCIVFNGTVIGEHCHIKNAIIDKNVTIPNFFKIGYDTKQDSQQFMITDNHIVVIPKNMTVV
jgi:glucose-1-phosphate adenylyltransferase